MRVTSQDILHGPMGNTLYRMTVPMVIGIFSMMAFSAVDIFFVSMMGSEELAAISFTLPVTMMLFNLIIGLSVATSVLVGSAIGRGDHSQAARLTTDSLMFTVLLTLIVSTAGFFTIDPLFR
ncbi:MAG: MATE family efflux transporter, partial [Gammaproteobacteria bacterium]